MREYVPVVPECLEAADSPAAVADTGDRVLTGSVTQAFPIELSIESKRAHAFNH